MRAFKKGLIMVFLDGPQFFGWVVLGLACISPVLAILSMPILCSIATADD